MRHDCCSKDADCGKDARRRDLRNNKVLGNQAPAWVYQRHFIDVYQANNRYQCDNYELYFAEAPAAQSQ